MPLQHSHIDVTRIGRGPSASEAAITDTVWVGWGDAAKHRQVLTTESGREVHLQLPRGSYLADGSVLSTAQGMEIVVRRPAESAVVVRFAENAHDPHLTRHLVRLGYVLGNQHAPIELTDEGVMTPLFTGAQAALEMLESLGITGWVESRPLACHGWSNTSADNHGQHRHD